jgi:hypothetical protein
VSKSHISKALRERVTLAARQRCGYCLTSEHIVGALMEIDHILPEALGGRTEEENLWLACSRCNQHKADRVVALDPVGGDAVPLFDPRRQRWNEHFAWTQDGDRIEGLTPVGRATIIALQLNRPELVRARQRWIAVGWHPPED